MTNDVIQHYCCDAMQNDGWHVTVRGDKVILKEDNDCRSIEDARFCPWCGSQLYEEAISNLYGDGELVASVKGIILLRGGISDSRLYVDMGLIPTERDKALMGRNIRHKLKQAQFAVNRGRKIAFLAAVVALPTGAAELIVNHDAIKEKLEYYLNAYDDNMCLCANPKVQIVDVLIRFTNKEDNK